MSLTEMALALDALAFALAVVKGYLVVRLLRERE